MLKEEVYYMVVYYEPNKKLFADTVSANKKLFADSGVPIEKKTR